MTVLETILTVAAALFGGLNILQFVFLKQTRRKYSAEASGSEFEVIKSTVVFLQEQLDSQVKKMAEQTELVRKMNNDLLQDAKDIADLKLQEQKYHCEVRGCPNRVPPNGY